MSSGTNSNDLLVHSTLRSSNNKYFLTFFESKQHFICYMQVEIILDTKTFLIFQQQFFFLITTEILVMIILSCCFFNFCVYLKVENILNINMYIFQPLPRDRSSNKCILCPVFFLFYHTFSITFEAYLGQNGTSVRRQ